MAYSRAELASFTDDLRADADEAMVLLAKYADATRASEAIDHWVRLEQIARTFDLTGWWKERDAIAAAMTSLRNYVEIRCRHARDLESKFSIPNYYPADHKTARAYAARVAAEKRDLKGFSVARKAIIARAGLVLSGTVLDATLERLRTEPLTAPVVVEAVCLADAMGEAA